jgi:hypothetical protein
MDSQKQISAVATERRPADPSSDAWLPLTQAAAKLKIGYYQARELALKGQLEVQFRRSRLYVSAASIARFKARN